MTGENHPIRQTLDRAVGQRLQKVFGSIQVFEEKIEREPPISLWFSFDGLLLFRLYAASDGWQLGVDESRPEPIDMGESGEIMICDLSNKPVFAPMIGKELRAAWTIESKSETGVVGIRLDFSLSLRPVVLNWGDELYVSEEYPSDSKPDELVEISIGGKVR